MLFEQLGKLICKHNKHYWPSARLCGAEQRTPPIFGRVAITLGIGPHSSFDFVFFSVPVKRLAEKSISEMTCVV